MSHEFHVGQRVVCVSDLTSHKMVTKFRASVPEKGEVYTIRDIFASPSATQPGVYVRLAELVNQSFDTCFGPFEPAFKTVHFRPLRDISIFTAILNGARVPEETCDA
jgi:hypothetical protein